MTEIDRKKRHKILLDTQDAFCFELYNLISQNDKVHTISIFPMMHYIAATHIKSKTVDFSELTVR